ncbi:MULTISPECIES: TonB-dependent receptor [unclassified Sphingomonas]|nr:MULTISPECIES: TonB-dependent receptor [unclassified Sphingomonas]KQX23431.1 hypothetical protein ASD17_03785 [Sphingomonas sp. Root1294]KQY68282.1 hypothetical protein ASD39_06305 [Sphingomonas sp. Root50]KRB91182.1 hypothetical protein ASE22_13110 [Sphingomonas sp. Root720]
MASTAAISTSALAQTGGAEGGSAGDIVVTARKRSENLQKVPESISVISSTVIANAGVRNVEDFSKFTPNVNINTGFGPAYTVLTARGITTPQGAEAPMAIVIDGVQLSDLTFLNIDLVNIDRIEVLRGPQGSLYGRNAIAGAINITTKKPTNALSAMAKISYANGDDKVAQANVSGPIARDALYFSLSGSYRKFDGNYKNDPAQRITTFPDPAFNGYFPNVGTRRNANMIDDKSVRAALIYNEGGALNVELRGSYTDSVFGSFGNELVLGQSDLNDKRSHLATNLDLDLYRKLYEGSLKVDYDFGGATLSSISYRNRARQSQYGDGDFSTLPALTQDVRINIDAFSQEVRLASNNSSGITWLVGGFYQDRKTGRVLVIPFELNPTVFLQDSNDHNRSKAYAVFGQTTADIGSAFQLTLGLRYDHDKRSSDDDGSTAPPNNAVAKSFKALQPKMSLKYNWDQNFQTYATVARGFRSGGFNAATSTQRQYAQETNWSYELGFKGSFLDNRLFLSGAVYYIELKNEQIYFVTTNPPAQNLTNIDKTSKTGFELEMTARPIDRLDVTLGIGTADSVIKGFAAQPATIDNKTPQSNGYSVTGSMQYRIPLGGDLELRPFVSFERRGPIYWSADNSFRTGPKNLADLRLFLDSEHWSIGAFAKNITNTRFPTVVGPNAANFAPLGGPVLTLRTMNTPRSYGIEANVRF